MLGPTSFLVHLKLLPMKKNHQMFNQVMFFFNVKFFIFKNKNLITTLGNIAICAKILIIKFTFEIIRLEKIFLV